MSFDLLGLCEPLLRAVRAANYTTPTPVQQQAIPPISAGRDLLGCAQTGTGKTAAFAIPLIQQLHLSRVALAASHSSSGSSNGCAGRRVPKVLVLSPTRELAMQINESFRKYGKRTKLRSVVIYGGVSQHPQTDSLQRGVDIVVATPGRLLDLLNQGFVDLGSIQSVVLDEADHMLDMGFLPDVRRILDQLPKERQTLLFSATMPPDIQALAEKNMVDPVRVSIKADKLSAAAISQSVYYLPSGAKPGFLIKLLKTKSPGTALVFTRTKRNADSVVERLSKAGLRADAIHSNKSQNKRQRTLASFRAGNLEVLVATDIAARGIDVRDIHYVVNYDLPDVADTYTHRIGRTGRAGKQGVAVTLCEASKKKSLQYLEKHLGYRLNEGERLPELVHQPYQKTPQYGSSPQRSRPDGEPESPAPQPMSRRKPSKKSARKPLREQVQAKGDRGNVRIGKSRKNRVRKKTVRS